MPAMKHDAAIARAMTALINQFAGADWFGGVRVLGKNRVAILIDGNPDTDHSYVIGKIVSVGIGSVAIEAVFVGASESSLSPSMAAVSRLDALLSEKQPHVFGDCYICGGSGETEHTSQWSLEPVRVSCSVCFSRRCARQREISEIFRGAMPALLNVARAAESYLDADKPSQAAIESEGALAGALSALGAIEIGGSKP